MKRERKRERERERQTPVSEDTMMRRKRGQEDDFFFFKSKRFFWTQYIFSVYFVGRHIVIRAVRGLQPGDVIAENYGPIFTKRTLAERQRTLTGRYWFRCTCKACQEDWPHFENLTNDSVRLRCPTEGCSGLHSRAQQRPGKPIKCPGCQKKICLEDRLACLQECETLYARGLASMEDERVEEAIGILCDALKRFHRVACPPHRDTHLAEIALSSCLIDYGNTWRPAVL
ncbi:hypothetical protein ACFW04_006499 [Cataglyphis niger]